MPKLTKDKKDAIKKETVIKEVRWDLIALIANENPENQKQIQTALEVGYEPFAISPHMVVPESKDILNIKQAPQMKMENMIWLKRGTLVEIKNFEEDNQNVAP